MLLHLISILLSQLKSNLFSFNKSFTIVLLSILVFRLNIISADIAVISSSNRTVDVFVDFELGFAASVPSDGITGRIVVAEPEDACNPIASPPETNRSSLKWFVLIKRYSCDFKTKVQNAMRAGFHAAIIYNIDLTAVKKYSLVHSPQTESGITIPAVLVSFDDGWTLKKEYLWDKGFYVMILPDLPFNLNAYLLPFAIVIGVCLLLMISFMIVKCVRDRKRRLRHRLSSRHLKQIPIAKFKKGDQYDTCAICLEEYIEGEKLRILPCAHAYHVKCIDPWLTKNRRVCPVCKGKVILPGMSDISDTDSDSENGNNNGANERTPLLLSNANHNRQRNDRRRHRSYPQTHTSNPNDEQINEQIVEDERHSESGPLLVIDNVSVSAPNVRMVEADITPVIAPTQLSVNCDCDESVVEFADEATVPVINSTHIEPKASKNRRQDVIV